MSVHEPSASGTAPSRKRPGVGDDLVAADLVVALALLGAVVLGDDVGAVERVVERTPARVGGVQREPRVEDRHHQLRAGGGRDLVVDTGGGDREVRRLGLQVADVGEELPVVLGVEGADHPRAVPLVDLGLQVVAAGEQVLVLRGQVGDDLVDARPERVGVEVGARQRLVVDEVVQHRGDAQVTHRHAFGHDSSLACTCAAMRACRMQSVCDTVDPAYPAVTGLIPGGGVQQRGAALQQPGPQRRGPLADRLLGPHVFARRPPGVSTAIGSNPSPRRS